jgi:uncharacterized OsmC-like protein
VSQVAAKKKLVLDDATVNVLAHFREQGSVLKGTAQGSCERFDVEMALQSDEPEAEISALIRMARQMCFTESALTERVELTHSFSLNGQAIG